MSEEIPPSERHCLEVTPEGVYIGGIWVPALNLNLRLSPGNLAEADLSLELHDQVVGIETHDAQVYINVRMAGKPQGRFRVVEVLPDGKDVPEVPARSGVAEVAPAASVPVQPAVPEHVAEVPSP